MSRYPLGIQTRIFSLIETLTSLPLILYCGGAISWRSVKQSCIPDSTMEAKYVVAYEVA